MAAPFHIRLKINIAQRTVHKIILVLWLTQLVNLWEDSGFLSQHSHHLKHADIHKFTWTQSRNCPFE